MKQNFKSRIKSFLENIQNSSSKEFLIYLCIDFSFLLNGLLLILMGALPIITQNSPQNEFRVLSGALFIAIWFIFLPTLSINAKDKIIIHFAFSLIALIGLFFILLHWLKHGTSSSFVATDIIIELISIPIAAYFIYLLINFFKLLFFVVKKLITNIFPDAPEKGLVFTLEAITSLFVAISSLIAAFWGIITAIKTLL